ncbi:hypothetical protein ACSSS7_002824 [Eimeria intestinalis]
MSAWGGDPMRSAGLGSSSEMTSSTYSSSVSSSISSVSGSEDAAPKQAAAVQPTRKPFIPPKIATGKRMPKRPLPKRTPLPPLAKAGVGDPLQRQEELAALRTHLLMSRATIGQRWKEAWQSVDSSKNGISGESDFEDLDAILASESLSGYGVPAGGTYSAQLRARLLSSSESTLNRSGSDKDIMTLLEREISSGTDGSRSDSARSLNLTSSGFANDLSIGMPPQDSPVQLSPPPGETIMPRPLQHLKLRLFQGSGEDSSSVSSPEISCRTAPWRQLPSRETSVPEEYASSEKQESEEQESEGEEGGGVDVDQDHDELEEPEEEAGVTTPTERSPSESEEEPPQLKWEIDQVEESEAEEEQQSRPEPKPRARVETKVVQRPLQAGDLQVEDRLDEDACQEDFERREMTDRILYEITGDPLTPKLDRLRAERIKLAEWAKKLGGRERTEEDKPVPYRPPLVRPALKDVGSLFPRAEVDRPLTSDLAARGEGIEARMGKNALLPSTRVWQVEQRAERLQRHAAQQKEHLLLLQCALRKQEDGGQPAGDSRYARSSGFDEEQLSPRTVELKMYEEQCAYLGAQLDEEHEFCDAYRQQLNTALFKNLALKKRHENAVEAIQQQKAMQQQQRAKHMEAEEQLVDLQDQVERELTKRDIETSVRQQREQQALSLQERYAQLVHYLQEAEEKRSAYEDGLREAQSHAQKAAALLQTKEVELAYAKHFMETHHTQMLEKEVLRRKERDRANLAEKQVEQMNGSLAEKETQISGLMEKISEGEARLQLELQKHDETRETLQQVQSELKKRDAEVDALQLQIEDQRKAAAVVQNKMAALEKLAAEFDAFAGETRTDEAELEAWRDALEARRSKALALLQAAELSALSVMAQVDESGGGAQAVTALSQQVPSFLFAKHSNAAIVVHEVEALRVAREEELSVHDQEYKKLSEERRAMEEQLQQKEEAAQSLQRKVASLTSRLKRESLKLKNSTRRVVASAPAFGRKSEHFFSRELRTMRTGSTVEMWMNSSSGNRRESRHLKMFKHGIVMWTEDLTGKKGYKKGEHLVARDIIGIDFGSSSSSYLMARNEMKGKEGNVLPEQIPPPWRCFTVRTLANSYAFIATSDEAAQDWIIGLGRLSKLPFAPTMTSRRELVVHRVMMKLHAYAEQRGIPLVAVWKEAINTTLAQMPQVRQRGAEKGSRETKKQPKEKGSQSHDRTSAEPPSTSSRKDAAQQPSKRGHRESKTSVSPDAKGKRRGRRESVSPGKREAAREATSPASKAARDDSASPASPAVASAEPASPANKEAAPFPPSADAGSGSPDEPASPARKSHRRREHSSSGRHRRRSADPGSGGHRGNSHKSPERRRRRSSNEGSPSAEGKKADARRSPDEGGPDEARLPSEGGSPKAHQSKPQAEAAERPEKTAKKKFSRGILSRAGSIFRRNATGTGGGAKTSPE